MSKIKKIDIDNFGSYKNYTWINRDTEFKDINIIYGRNYSGKTTLSRVFKCLENKSLHDDYENQNFCFTLEDNSSIDNNSITTNEFEICVYNTDFVKENLNWLHNQDGTIKPFTILGEANIETEDKINVIVNNLGDKPEDEKEEPNKGLFFNLWEVKNKFNKSNEKYKDLTTALEFKLKTKANQEMKHNALYKKANYNIKGIKDDIIYIKNNNISLLSDDTVESNKKLINESIKKDIDELPEKKPNFEKLYNEVKEILTKSIKPSFPIQELLNDSLLQEWVRSGSSLHKEKRDTCAFCGNLIDESTWKKTR